ncbi:MAG: hypothetical protein AB2L14_21725 [Candidatus Xenobiia bacterium LiM19]
MKKSTRFCKVDNEVLYLRTRELIEDFGGCRNSDIIRKINAGKGIGASRLG